MSGEGAHRYPLEAVETARRAEVGALDRALADRLREQDERALAVTQRREALEAHDRESGAELARRREAMERAHSPADMIQRREWEHHRRTARAALEADLERSRVALRDAERATHEARLGLVTAKAALETVLRHRESWKQERRRAAGRKADALLDELATSRGRTRR